VSFFVPPSITIFQPLQVEFPIGKTPVNCHHGKSLEMVEPFLFDPSGSSITMKYHSQMAS
jgi:hypothetical protein